VIRSIYRRLLGDDARRALALGTIVQGLRQVDPRDALRYRSLHKEVSGPPVSVRPRALRRPILLRPGTSDIHALGETFAGLYHLPRWAPRRILDLGANIGLTAAHYRSLFPDAAIVAVEMDAENVALCESNTAGLQVAVVHSAVWTESNTMVKYTGSEGNEYGFHIPGADARVGTITRTAPTVSVNDLVARFGPADFVKIDIEGAEREVLARATEWAAMAREILVETHGDYNTEDCISDLQRLGFAPMLDDRHWRAVRALRPSTSSPVPPQAPRSVPGTPHSSPRP
jgi:FkbM family methyltransferase